MFSALARLALAELTELGWYGSQLLFHLSYEGRGERMSACTPEQRRAIVVYLRHLVETRFEIAERYLCDEELLQAVALWSGETNAGTDAKQFGSDPRTASGSETLASQLGSLRSLRVRLSYA